MLCHAAGLTERYFYESFCSTESLFLAVLDHLTLDFKTRLLEVIESYDHGQVHPLSGTVKNANDRVHLAQLALHLYFTEVQNPVFARITLIEVLGVSAAVDQKYIENTRELSALVTQIIHIMEPDIQIEPQDEAIVGTALVGSIVTLATGWMLQGYPYSIEQMVNNCLKILMGTAHQLISSATQENIIPVASNAISKQVSAM